MATTPVPAFAAPPDFPALSDRATGTYNSKAYAWATAIQGTTGPNIHAIALTAKDNADDAALSTTAAAEQVVLAADQVLLAEAQALEASDQADRAQGMADAAAANAAYKGDWASLSGALAVPATVTHSGDRYVLLSNVANVAAHEPGVSAVWEKLFEAQEKLISGVNLKTLSGQSLLGGGDITLGTSITPTVLSANTTLAPADAGKLIDCTGSMTLITLPLASAAGSGWFVIVRNKRGVPVPGSGSVTVGRSGSNTIDTMTSMDVLPGLSYMILCNGTGYVTTKMGGQGYLYITSGTSWTCPAGVHQAKITVIGAGGGGGGGKTSGSNGSGGGQGGVGSVFVPLTPGTSYTLAIGAGGTAGTGGASPTDGVSGGNTTFTYPGAGTITSQGGGPGAKGETSVTTVIWGGAAGGAAFFSNDISVGIPAASGRFAYGTGGSSGSYSPSFLVGSNFAGRGGSGGSPGGNGTAGSPGAIIIEY